MKTILGSIRRHLLGLSVEETSYVRRGFRGAASEMQSRLDQIGVSFLGGYHAALEHDTLEHLASELNSRELELRGFGFEGAAMGLALLDRLTPWRRNRVSEFLRGAGHAHVYMVYVGIGWVWARLPFRARAAEARLDPLLRWLAFDGWGFHEGYFHSQEFLAGRAPPRSLSGYELRVFDQGLGRSFWFVNGGNVELIARTINNLPELRRADLWSGVGLSSSYAGQIGEEELRRLRELAGEYAPQLAQGCAFAAKARQRAGNLTEYTERAAHALCGMSALEAARVCDTTLENLPANAAEPAYELWRRRIQIQFQRLEKLQETSR